MQTQADIAWREKNEAQTERNKQRYRADKLELQVISLQEDLRRLRRRLERQQGQHGRHPEQAHASDPDWQQRQERQQRQWQADASRGAEQWRLEQEVRRLQARVAALEPEAAMMQQVRQQAQQAQHRAQQHAQEAQRQAQQTQQEAQQYAQQQAQYSHQQGEAVAGRRRKTREDYIRRRSGPASMHSAGSGGGLLTGQQWHQAAVAVIGAVGVAACLLTGGLAVSRARRRQRDSPAQRRGAGANKAAARGWLPWASDGAAR